MRLAAFTALACIALFALSKGPVTYAGDGRNLTSVNGAVSAEPGQTYDTISTVNGQVHVGSGVIADEAKTVNGQLRVDSNAKLGEASTVNGSLHIDEGSTIEHNASTVNGSLSLAERTRVGGDVSTVSGNINIDGAEVQGSVVTRNGDIDLTDGARVHGSIHIKEKNSSGWNWGKDEPLKVHICSTCVVDGDLRFDREVELKVDQGAKIGKVIGDKVKRL